MSSSVMLEFYCDNCKLRCTLCLYYSGELTGWTCPHCKKYFKLDMKEVEKTIVDAAYNGFDVHLESIPVYGARLTIQGKEYIEMRGKDTIRDLRNLLNLFLEEE